MTSQSFKDMVIQPLINTIPFSLIKRIGSSKLIILYYHVVNDEDVPHIVHLYRYKRTKQFIDDLEFLLENYSPVGLPDVIRHKRGKHILPPNSFLLTFDDGFREIYDIVAPILLSRGIPATFFIPSSFLDNKEMCYQQKASLLSEKIRKGISSSDKSNIEKIFTQIGLAYSGLSGGILKIDYRRREAIDRIAHILQIDFKEYLEAHEPYLTSNQVKTLIGQGFTIGAHSMDHPYYSALSLPEQLEQTVVSVKKLRQNFNLDYGAFAFPHNDHGVPREFFEKIHESGLVDISFGTGGMLNGDIENHRQRVSLEKPLLPARKLIAWQYARKLYKQMIS